VSLLLVKVGGSLFDLPTLGIAIEHWLAQQTEGQILLLAGGGDFVEALRKYQPLHHLNDVDSHWLAVRALGISARMLAQILPGKPLLEEFEPSLPQERILVLDGHRFLEWDEKNTGALPKSWSVTTDSIAVRAGRQLGASRVVLLKSRDFPFDGNWLKAAREGYVDGHFPTIAAETTLSLECLNFRGWMQLAGYQKS
jgi:aspartokinase-like uncharacterized kinase